MENRDLQVANFALEHGYLIRTKDCEKSIIPFYNAKKCQSLDFVVNLLFAFVSKYH